MINFKFMPATIEFWFFVYTHMIYFLEQKLSFIFRLYEVHAGLMEFCNKPF